MIIVVAWIQIADLQNIGCCTDCEPKLCLFDDDDDDEDDDDDSSDLEQARGHICEICQQAVIIIHC
jgi:hypothetical protein